MQLEIVQLVHLWINLYPKKTGQRTTGVTNVKTYTKGLLQGAGEAFDDFRRGINTRGINIDKFEVGQGGKNFKDKGLGKILK